MRERADGGPITDTKVAVVVETEEIDVTTAMALAIFPTTAQSQVGTAVKATITCIKIRNADSSTK
jgi:hypothetical protein